MPLQVLLVRLAVLRVGASRRPLPALLLRLLQPPALFARFPLGVRPLLLRRRRAHSRLLAGPRRAKLGRALATERWLPVEPLQLERVHLGRLRTVDALVRMRLDGVEAVVPDQLGLVQFPC